jgi:hypothetical protein
MHLNLIKKRLGLLVAALALCMAMSVAVTPALGAAYWAVDPGNGYVEIKGSGATAQNFTFWVQHPFALGLDADYWNLTVYCDHTNNVSESTNTTYYVHVHIYDGATNVTNNVTVAAKNDRVVYANISMVAGVITTLTENSSAVYTVEVIKGGPNAVHKIYVGEVQLMTTEMAAGMVNALLLIIPLIVMVMIIGWVGGLAESISGKINRRK